MKIVVFILALATAAVAAEADRPIKELAAERLKIQLEMKAMLEDLQKKQARFNELTNMIADKATKDTK